MTESLNICNQALNFLEKCIADPDKFLEPQQEQAIYYKKLTKQLYKLSTKLQNGQITNSKALPKLLVDGFDEEQIWQQLELKNIPVLKHYQKCVSDFDLEALSSICNKDAYTNNDTAFDESSSDENENEGYVFDDDSESDIEDLTLSKQLTKSNSSKKEKQQKSIIDDQFFKQSQLEEFLKIEDLKFEQEVDGKNRATDESEEIDWEKDYSDEGDTELERKSSRNLMYDDFFDPPENSEHNDGENSENTNEDSDEIMHEINREEYDTRDYEPDDDEDENEDQEKDAVNSSLENKNLLDENNSSSDNEKESSVQEKTTFQKQIEKEQKRIKDMEEKLLQPKPWQLTGEVDASRRPENSLMKQPTVFDSNVKQNIELTDDLTSKIEEIIRMAISNKAWCDVERKIKPVETSAYKKLEPLEQTKSKKSLAEVYEDDYLKLKNKPEEVEDPRHTEISKLMDQLTPELYALFSHIPRPPVPEIKVVNNMPAITVEEVAPVGLSDAALLAPEEIKKRARGDVKGDTEKSITDKKRERRKKKLHQKLKHKRKEEKLRELAVSNPELAKKHEKLLAMQQLKRSKNAVIADSDQSKKVKSSKDFFTRLDETVNKKSAKLKR